MLSSKLYRTFVMLTIALAAFGGVPQAFSQVQVGVRVMPGHGVNVGVGVGRPMAAGCGVGMACGGGYGYRAYGHGYWFRGGYYGWRFPVARAIGRGIWHGIRAIGRGIGAVGRFLFGRRCFRGC